MLIIYRKLDGVVVANSGTNSLLPNGVPFEDEVQNAIKEHGGTSADYGEYRLHDDNDAALVQQIMEAWSYVLTLVDGVPAGVTTFARVQLTCPATATVGQAVTVAADAVGGAGIEAILYVDGVEQARANMPATWDVIFESAGKYQVRVESGRHSVAYAEVVVS